MLVAGKENYFSPYVWLLPLSFAVFLSVVIFYNRLFPIVVMPGAMSGYELATTLREILEG